MKFLKILIVVLIAYSLGWSSTLSWKLVDSLAHPQTRFTQGLSWDGKTLLESTGLVGSSTLYRLAADGKVLDSAVIPKPHFGEGSVRVGDEILVLTWRSGKGLIFDAATLDAKGEFVIPGEGWGLTFADNALWMSNGSSSLLKLAPDTKTVIGKLDVTHKGRPLTNLNELEAVGKFLLANVWFSDSIAVINRADGVVTNWIDCSSLAKRVRKGSAGAEVLNGIAWDGRLLWITGKLWSKIFALDLKELKP